MKEFPMDSSEWYSFRDDRTVRIDGTKGFEKYRIGVIVDPDTISKYSSQVMVLLATNLLSRWCRDIVIEMSECQLKIFPGYEGDFKLYIKDEMQKIDPHGNFRFGVVDEGKVDYILNINHERHRIQKPNCWISGNGWIGGLENGDGPHNIIQDDDNTNPIGPGFAACLGVSDAFRHAIGMKSKSPYLAWYSLYDNNMSNKSPDGLLNPKTMLNMELGRIYLIGCGAVGSSLAYLLKLTSIKGELYAFDFDKVSISNCNRTLAFNANDGFYKVPKVDVVARELQYSKMATQTFDIVYNDFPGTGKYLDYPPDILLSLANEKNVWKTIEDNYPPITFHATTSENWTINVGRHIPFKDWCLVCRFKEEMEYEFKPDCSEGQIPVNQSISDNGSEKKLGVLPFLSPMAAVTLLAEIIKTIITEGKKSKNYLQFNTQNPEVPFVMPIQLRSCDCICTNRKKEDYPEEIKRTRYWGF